MIKVLVIIIIKKNIRIKRRKEAVKKIGFWFKKIFKDLSPEIKKYKQKKKPF